ncbi:potassium-transporting ATPase subunit F [Jeongeupia wiesaeckerbachi]
MSTIALLIGAAAVAQLAYLVYALFNPERF